jgi:hypothetical protein
MSNDADYLHERIASGTTDPLSEGSEEDFIAWREILNVSGEQIFTRRLTSLDLEENQARRLTRRAGANPNRSAPIWRQLLRKALGSEERNQPSFDANQPFARIWAPITGYAIKQLSPHDTRLVSRNALVSNCANQSNNV